VRRCSDYKWRVGTDFEWVVLCCPPSDIPTWIWWGLYAVAYPGIVLGGGSTNSVEDREDGELGAVAP